MSFQYNPNRHDNEHPAREGWGFVTQATLKKTAGPIPQN